MSHDPSSLIEETKNIEKETPLSHKKQKIGDLKSVYIFQAEEVFHPGNGDIYEYEEGEDMGICDLDIQRLMDSCDR